MTRWDVVSVNPQFGDEHVGNAKISATVEPSTARCPNSQLTEVPYLAIGQVNCSEHRSGSVGTWQERAIFDPTAAEMTALRQEARQGLCCRKLVKSRWTACRQRTEPS